MSLKQFDFGERLGLFLIVQAATLSTLACSAILLYITYNGFKKLRERRTKGVSGGRTDSSDSMYFVNLMVAELIQAIGSLMNIRWIKDAHIAEDSFCTAQGAIKQIGDVTVALTSLVIAFHTFSVLVLRWRAPRLVSRVALGAIWLFVAIVIIIGNALHKESFYGDTGYWCWIRETHMKERIALEYVWLWLAAGLMLVMYGIIALVIRGLVQFDHGVHLRFGKSQQSGLSEATEADKQVANLMMFYPAVYIVCVFPVTLVRWLKFGGLHDVPPGATIFGSILFSLSGFLNAILYKVTRPDLVSGTVPPTEEKPRRGAREDEGHLPDVDVESMSLPPDDEGQGRLPDNDSDDTHWR